MRDITQQYFSKLLCLSITLVIYA